MSPQKNRYVVKRSRAGLGLFATVPFAKGDFIIEYVGKKLTTAQADRKGGKYLFQIDDATVIDGTTRTNTARYLNHACKPNCEAVIEQWPNGDHIMIYAKKKIAIGEELTYDYGKEYVETFITPHGCRCVACSTTSSTATSL